jgi:hypothetical protein
LPLDLLVSDSQAVVENDADRDQTDECRQADATKSSGRGPTACPLPRTLPNPTQDVTEFSGFSGGYRREPVADFFHDGFRTLSRNNQLRGLGENTPIMNWRVAREAVRTNDFWSNRIEKRERLEKQLGKK